MNVLGFAWRSLIRQPARTSLGVLGVAAVGALLFDMLLLSHGLVLSMRDMLGRGGFDLRVTATDSLPSQGPPIDAGGRTASAIAALPAVRSAMALRFIDATLEVPQLPRARAQLQGVTGSGVRPWTLRRGRDVQAPGDVVVNDNAARTLRLTPGMRLLLRASCVAGSLDALPPVTLTVVGVADFPFDTATGFTVATAMGDLRAACGSTDGDRADVIMVASREEAGGDEAAAQIGKAFPALHVLSNEDAVGRFERGGFTYFRQISTVLTTVTLAFAVLLITVLLTVSVNQRLGEIAALRALGFTRGRVVADVLCESALIVGTGGLLSLPIGGALAVVLDRILKNIPGIPAEVHFFVFQPDALGLHVGLMVITALVAALYPMQAVARLPIAATLRNEVVG